MADRVEDLLQQGLDAADRGSVAEAIVLLDRAVAVDPESSVAYFCRASVKGDFGEYQGAIADFQQALDLNPNLPEAHRGIGVAYYKSQQFQSAIVQYGMAIEKNPTLAYVWGDRGLARLEIGEYGSAIEDLTEAIRLDGNNPISFVIFSGR
jgi:tetratricopeptide (TPR) repeat protein